MQTYLVAGNKLRGIFTSLTVFFLTLVRSASLNWSERIPRFIVLLNFSKESKQLHKSFQKNQNFILSRKVSGNFPWRSPFLSEASRHRVANLLKKDAMEFILEILFFRAAAGEDHLDLFPEETKIFLLEFLLLLL